MNTLVRPYHSWAYPPRVTPGYPIVISSKRSVGICGVSVRRMNSRPVDRGCSTFTKSGYSKSAHVMPRHERLTTPSFCAYLTLFARSSSLAIVPSGKIKTHNPPNALVRARAPRSRNAFDRFPWSWAHERARKMKRYICLRRDKHESILSV